MLEQTLKGRWRIRKEWAKERKKVGDQFATKQLHKTFLIYDVRVSLFAFESIFAC